MVDLAGLRYRADPARTGPAHVLHSLVRHRRRAGFAHLARRAQLATGYADAAVGAAFFSHHCAVVQGVSKQEARCALDSRQRDWRSRPANRQRFRIPERPRAFPEANPRQRRMGMRRRH